MMVRCAERRKRSVCGVNSIILKKIKKVLLSFTLFFLKSVSLYENKNVRFFWLESATRKWTNEN